MALDTQYSFLVSKEYFTKCQPFAFDIGGSQGKVVYRTKKDQEDSNDVVRCRFFKQADLSMMLEFVRKACGLLGPDSDAMPAEVVCCGIGSSIHRHMIESALNVKLTIVHEALCQINSFMFLASQHPIKDYVVPFDAEVERQTLETYGAYYGGDHPQLYRGSGEWLDGPHVVYPCIVAMTGSAFGFLKVQSDGSTESTRISWCGGRAFLGLGRMLCKVESFEELAELAKNGDSTNVDETMHDLLPPAQDASDYDNISTTVPDVPVFRFGKAARFGTDLESYSREDIAAALLKVWTNNIVLECESIASAENCTSVYFQGGFTQNSTVQNQISEHVTTQNMYRVNLRKKDPIKFYFLKNGVFYGAFGSLMSACFKTPGWEVPILWKPH